MSAPSPIMQNNKQLATIVALAIFIGMMAVILGQLVYNRPLVSGAGETSIKEAKQAVGADSDIAIAEATPLIQENMGVNYVQAYVVSKEELVTGYAKLEEVGYTAYTPEEYTNISEAFDDPRFKNVYAIKFRMKHRAEDEYTLFGEEGIWGYCVLVEYPDGTWALL